MKKLIVIVMVLFCGFNMVAQDWANLGRYKADNEKLKAASRKGQVVFMGNSITEGWGKTDPEFFQENPYINRGISGQTTPQMLVRFKADVINLKPDVVVILAGTNDIAGNTGPSTLDMIMDNITSMAQLAVCNNIKVILCSVLPASDYPWSPGKEPAGKIVTLNKMIKDFAEANDLFYTDYYSLMVNADKGMKSEYSKDGVHPNKRGYSIMEPVIRKAIRKALKTK